MIDPLPASVSPDPANNLPLIATGLTIS